MSSYSFLRKSLLLGGIGAVASLGSLYGDTLQTNGFLTSWSSSLIGTSSSPVYNQTFWDHPSGDGPASNAGWCVIGGGQCNIGSTPGALPYLTTDGNNGSSGPSSISFNGAGPVVPTYMAAYTLTANQASDQFGWYTIQNGVPVLNPLYTGLGTGSGTVSFSPSGDYGFYLQTTAGGGSATYTFFTQTQYNTAVGGTADSLQHFALFDASGGNNYYLAIEDTPVNLSPSRIDYDFNDLVIHVVAIPEPSSFALLGLGVGFIGLARRSWKQPMLSKRS